MSFEIRFPTTRYQIHAAIERFKIVAGLPYFVGTIGGTHIEWHRRLTKQCFDYSCYNRFTLLLMLSACAPNRRFTYLQVGKPCLFGDATIFEHSNLLTT